LTAPHSVILVCAQRLLCGLLARAIGRDGRLDLVGCIDSPEALPDALRQYPADCVMLAVPPVQEAPQGLDELMAAHPATRFVVLRTDGSHMKLRWCEPHECALDDATLEELMLRLTRSIHALPEEPGG
jgi:DNA-binding NarL/FixJ family response regulator